MSALTLPVEIWVSILCQIDDVHVIRMLSECVSHSVQQFFKYESTVWPLLILHRWGTSEYNFFMNYYEVRTSFSVLTKDFLEILNELCRKISPNTQASMTFFGEHHTATTLDIVPP